MTHLLSQNELSLALSWYCEGIALSTIAEHYEMGVDELAKELVNAPMAIHELAVTTEIESK